MPEPSHRPEFSVSDAVAVLNQTLEYAYPAMVIIGEVSEFRVSKNKWLYFDIKDEGSKLKCFGTVFQLRMPLEDGMKVAVIAQPRIHNLYGFSLTIQSVRPVGEGSIKKASDLLFARLEKEGLFAPERKRSIPFAPEKIGLIASGESAAYADFMKIMQARWGIGEIRHYDVQVQGESAPENVCSAIQYFNQQAETVDALVIIRGGGSVDDLAAFSTEQVTRAVAASRIPTVVAIGHEVDQSLSELAADLSASTPSNAAELLYPDKLEELRRNKLHQREINTLLQTRLESESISVSNKISYLTQYSLETISAKSALLEQKISLLNSSHPSTTLKRGFALITKNGKLISSRKSVAVSDTVRIEFRDGSVAADIKGFN